jgi:glycosyltransferase involved in cell wall biosynthesis
MVENTQLVSVIIPLYNGASFLGGAIENVLAQNYQPLEIIVVDDGSTDASTEIAAAYPNGVRYVYQTNAGPAAARNRGIKLAQGPLIAFLDVDDLWSEHKLARQTAYLRANPTMDWFIRAWEHGVSKAVLEEVTLFYRKHTANMSHAQASINYGLTKLIKKHLDRGRAEPTFRPKLRSGYPGVVEHLGQPPGD